ncbi:DNA double-strand break repair nuclease NurA [Candidatus Bathyarchaeota archaeon]|nr:DNA double-strand break repair nuclease NurA [Candidatus Bathyarchaeota archaeon]
MNKIEKDLSDLKNKLVAYVDKGRQIGFSDIKQQPLIVSKPDLDKIKPLKKIKYCSSRFLAVDCSTRTLKRAHNWGIYLMRVAFASVENRNVAWGYNESLVSTVGDRRYRSNFLMDTRLQLESEMALRLLHEESKEDTQLYGPTFHGLDEGDYVLLDGASFFGGKRGFHTSLYAEALRKKVNLLAISKQSPMLCDEKGRDFMASTSILASFPLWIYHPIKEANMEEHLYGDVSLVKLCEDSNHVFRCDIMDSSKSNVIKLLSPLTSLSEDPRCLGYPITLWLAHEFSGASNSKLLQYYDMLEKELSNAGILETLRIEELSCSFADKIHGITNPFEGGEEFNRI